MDSLHHQEVALDDETLESLLDEIEGPHAAELLRQKERSEREFAQGRVVDWDTLKRRNRL